MIVRKKRFDAERCGSGLNTPIWPEIPKSLGGGSPMYAARNGTAEAVPLPNRPVLLQNGFTKPLLCGDSQKQVTSRQGEDEVRRPCGEEGGQLVGVAHCLKQACRHPINNGDTKCDGDSCQRAAAAPPCGKRNGQYSHHKGNQGEGNLLLELHFQADGVKPALLQILNVVSQLFVIHF